MRGERLVGASVCCYSVSEHGDVYLLLGREDVRPSWHGAGKWSDFGGGVDAGETAVQAAVRELDEETCGALVDADEVYANLRARDYLCRVTYVDSATSLAYVTFVVEVPWSTDRFPTFRARRSCLVGHAEAIGRRLVRPMVEKDMLMYWSIPTLVASLGRVMTRCTATRMGLVLRVLSSAIEANKKQYGTGSTCGTNNPAE